MSQLPRLAFWPAGGPIRQPRSLPNGPLFDLPFFPFLPGRVCSRISSSRLRQNFASPAYFASASGARRIHRSGLASGLHGGGGCCLVSDQSVTPRLGLSPQSDKASAGPRSAVFQLHYVQSEAGLEVVAQESFFSG